MIIVSRKKKCNVLYGIANGKGAIERNSGDSDIISLFLSKEIAEKLVKLYRPSTYKVVAVKVGIYENKGGKR